MNERLLQFIWQFQYYNKSGLSTVAGDPVQVISPGIINTNQGPDFSGARIKIAKTTWAGMIEMHIRTSDWKRHHHGNDRNYSSVVLHVVWEDDEMADDPKQAIPVLELRERVSKILLQRYDSFMNNTSFIPCGQGILQVRGLTWKSWKERLLAERLLRKSSVVEGFLRQSNHHWEESFWWIMARNFGLPVNASAFESIARSISVNVLAKHKSQIHQLEAILFGQAGLLEDDFAEDYPRLLQKEYRFLKAKYKLRPIYQVVFFLRMRPGNFPTVRLAQLAALLHESSHLFSRIKEAASVKEIRKWFELPANDYWHYHYRFDDLSSFKKKGIGESMTRHIIINTIVPVLFAYGNYNNEVKYKIKALQWLEETAAERNAIIRGFEQMGIENKNAFDSQSLIELKNEYCNKKRCLECAVGNWLLKGMSDE
jgi:hypothetical protein